LPFTLSAGVPYDVPSSTPRHASAIRRTSSNVTMRLLPSMIDAPHTVAEIVDDA
jgi:hypothetical protein